MAYYIFNRTTYQEFQIFLSIDCYIYNYYLYFHVIKFIHFIHFIHFQKNY